MFLDFNIDKHTCEPDLGIATHNPVKLKRGFMYRESPSQLSVTDFAFGIVTPNISKKWDRKHLFDPELILRLCEICQSLPQAEIRMGYILVEKLLHCSLVGMEQKTTEPESHNPLWTSLHSVSQGPCNFKGVFCP